MWSQALRELKVSTDMKYSLYVCLRLPPVEATVYLGLLLVFSWMEIKGVKTQIIKSFTEDEEKEHASSPPVPFGSKVTVFDALETRFKCSSVHVQVNMQVCLCVLASVENPPK